MKQSTRRWKDRSPFAVLTRHFFGRFFDNELLAPGGEVMHSLTEIFAILAVPGAFISIYYILVFAFRAVYHTSALQVDSWSDRCLLVSLSMILMALVTIVEWDTLFPDRKDYLNLVHLPVRIRTFFLAKIASLLLFMGIFTLALNGLSSLFFPLAATATRATTLDSIRFLTAHVLSVTAGSAFVFFTAVAAQGLCITVLPARFFRRVSLSIQSALLVFLLSVFLVFPTLVTKVKQEQQLFYEALYPPAWFTTLYDRILGVPSIHTLLPWTLAVGALAAVFALSMFFYGIAYRRQIAGFLESEGETTRSTSLFDWLIAVARRFLLSRPEEYAAFDFVTATLMRSRRHRTVLACCLGVGAAISLASLLSLGATLGFSALSRPHPTLFFVVATLAFLMVVGVRFAFTLPSDLAANWMFKTAHITRHDLYWSGVRKATSVLILAPVHLGGLIAFTWLWGWGVGWRAFLFQAVCTAVLHEWLFASFPKLPFTCSHLPGKADLKRRWPIYVTGYFAFCLLSGAAGYGSMSRPRWFWVLLAIAAALLIHLLRARKRFLSRRFTPIFDDEFEGKLLLLGVARMKTGELRTVT